MFVDEKTNVEIHADLNDSVIHGTFRPQDLIPAFMSVIKDTMEYVQIMNFVPSYAMEDDESEWWESEDCQWFLYETLFDTLNTYSPEGYYFGSHPGNGSDYGYWKCDTQSSDFF